MFANLERRLDPGEGDDYRSHSAELVQLLIQLMTPWLRSEMATVSHSRCLLFTQIIEVVLLVDIRSWRLSKCDDGSRGGGAAAVAGQLQGSPTSILA